MDMPETAEDRMRERIDLLAEYEAAEQWRRDLGVNLNALVAPTPAPANRHQRRRYAALARAARTR